MLACADMAARSVALSRFRFFSCISMRGFFAKVSACRPRKSQYKVVMGQAVGPVAGGVRDVGSAVLDEARVEIRLGAIERPTHTGHPVDEHATIAATASFDRPSL